MATDTSKFGDVFSAMREATFETVTRLDGLNRTVADTGVKQVAGISNISKILGAINAALKAQASILSGSFKLDKDALDFDKENKADEKRAGRLSAASGRKPGVGKDGMNEGFFQQILQDLLEGFSGIGKRDLIKAAVLAPILFSFARGFIGDFFDGFVEVTAAGITGVFAALRGGYNWIAKLIMRPFKNLFSPIVRVVRSIAASIRSFATGFTRVGKVVGGLLKFVKSFGAAAAAAFAWIPGAGTIRLLLGRLAWPITIILGIVEAVRSWRNSEGSFFEKFMSALGGLFSEIIGAPLDLLKGAVAWIVDQLGFTETAAAISEFSFSDTIRNIFTGLFRMVRDAVDWVVALFTWSDSNSPAFSLLEILTDWVKRATAWLGEIFSFFPSMDDIRTAILNMMPDWMRKLVGAPERTAAELIHDQNQELVAAQAENITRREELLAAETAAREKLEQATDPARRAGRVGWQRQIDTAVGNLERIQEEMRVNDARMEQSAAALVENESLLADDPERAALRLQLEELKVEKQRIIDAALGEAAAFGYKAVVNTAGIDAQIAELDQAIASYRKGSPGFVDFGPGALAVLHGREAVVPFDTPAGQLLNSFFDENYQPLSAGKLNYIADVAANSAMTRDAAQNMIMNMMPQVISNRPVNNNVSNNTTVNHISPARALDNAALPQ